MIYCNQYNTKFQGGNQMKKNLFIFALLACFLFATPLVAADKFTDVNPKIWYYPEIIEAHDKGLIAGTSETTFSPDQPMTRGMFVTILGRIEGIDPNDYILGYEHNFTDLKLDFYKPYVTWAYETGIVAGTSETLYAPDRPITRQEIATILDRYVNLYHYQLPHAPKVNQFCDAADIADFAKNGMENMRLYGIIQGDNYGKGLPLATATRAQGTCMLLRFYKLIMSATDQLQMGEGYCRLLCASAPAGNMVENSDEHDANLAKFRPIFNSYLDKNETLGGVIHTKWQGKFYYFGVIQKTIPSGGMNIYQTSKVVMLDANMKKAGIATLKGSKGEACYKSTYGIYSIKPYYTSQGIFIYIATSTGSETTTFDMVLVKPGRFAFLSIPNILLQVHRDPADNNSIKIRKMFMNENNNGFYLDKKPWETIDFTKFPYVLGYTGK